MDQSTEQVSRQGWGSVGLRVIMGRAERQALASQRSRMLQAGSSIMKTNFGGMGWLLSPALRCWMQVSRLKRDRNLEWEAQGGPFNVDPPSPLAARLWLPAAACRAAAADASVSMSDKIMLVLLPSCAAVQTRFLHPLTTSPTSRPQCDRVANCISKWHRMSVPPSPSRRESYAAASA